MSARRSSATRPWPAEGLERAEDCPICGSVERALIHKRLTDRVFFVAPGEWDLWRCICCQSAYLDPRPDPATIGLAYKNYYTHSKDAADVSRSALQSLRRMLGNGYRNQRFGTRLRPALPLGRLIGRLLPSFSRPIDIAYRFLPMAAHGARRVLDVGCGNGAFLVLARGAGWEVAGVEIDPVSRGHATDLGIEVRPSIGAWGDQPASFDYLTISHVIEHVHEPIALLRDSFDLLKPGGGLVIDTPNIDSLGHRIFGRDWLHLDPPRHLALFNRESLADAVGTAGFVDIRYHRRPDALRNSAQSSRRIAAGLDPSSAALPTKAPRIGILGRFTSSFSSASTEFLTLTANKPRP